MTLTHTCAEDAFATWRRRLLTKAPISVELHLPLHAFPGPVKELLGIPDEYGILFGMSFGYADDHPANKCRTDRVDLSEGVAFF